MNDDLSFRAAKTSLAGLFPDGDFRFHLTLRRGEPGDFFRRRDETGAVLAERSRWLAAEPERHAALLPEGEPLLAEFAGLCADWQLAAAPVNGRSGGRLPPAHARGHEEAEAQLRRLGAALEPDFLLLSPDAEGRFRLRGGALCFPTGWALEEKLGHTLDFIHGGVPGLNPALASPISQFLAKLKPGVAFQRDNWGIAASAELNLHPSRAVPAPVSPVALDRLWLRVEHQALVALPRTGGVAFGIRIALHRLDAVVAEAPIRRGLCGALATMPADLAAYKRLDGIRSELLARLGGHLASDGARPGGFVAKE